jgi:hypothetical protein
LREQGFLIRPVTKKAAGRFRRLAGPMKSGTPFKLVMAGLVPAIYVFASKK